MILVSIIIPIYNVQEYIEECLVSALKQTLREIEVICVNDGTPDNSMDIVRRYAEKDDRIVIVNKENGGLSSARNTGLKAARGEYVYFLDSDDYILENTMEVLYDQSQKYGLDSIFFDADSFFETEELAQKHKSYGEYYHRDDLYGEVVEGQKLFVKMYENGDFRPSACLQMNKRTFLLDNKICFREGIIHEDNLFSLKVTLHAKKTKHLSESFYMRRVREGSIMTNRVAKRSAYGYFICVKDLIAEVAEKAKDETFLKIYIEQLEKMRKHAVNILKSVSSEELDNMDITNSSEEKILFELLVRDYVDLTQKYEEKIASKKNNIRTLRIEKNKLTKRCKSLSKKIETIQKSKSYKIGKMVTYIPKKMKNFKGMKNLIKKIMRKIAPDFYMNRYTKVSIVMPVYNVEKYLEPCLDSLLGQTLRDIEIICVDDSSTDKSVEILNKYAAKDKRIRIFHQEHQGAGCARNIGIEKARGKYLLFLDSDDLFNKHMCEDAYRKAENFNAEIVLFAAKRMDMQTGKIEKMGWVLRTEQLPEDKVFSGKEIADRLFQVTSNCPWSKMFLKEFVMRNGIRFQNTKHANDTYFVRTNMALANRMVVLNKTFVTYRFNDGDNTQSVKHLAPLEFYKAFLAVKEKLEQERMFELYKRSYVNWALTECLFNYNTMKTDKAKSEIRKKLLDEGFDRLGISLCNENDIDNQKVYEEYLEFVK